MEVQEDAGQEVTYKLGRQYMLKEDASDLPGCSSPGAVWVPTAEAGRTSELGGDGWAQ